MVNIKEYEGSIIFKDFITYFKGLLSEAYEQLEQADDLKEIYRHQGDIRRLKQLISLQDPDIDITPYPG